MKDRVIFGVLFLLIIMAAIILFLLKDNKDVIIKMISPIKNIDYQLDEKNKEVNKKSRTGKSETNVGEEGNQVVESKDEMLEITNQNFVENNIEIKENSLGVIANMLKIECNDEVTLVESFDETCILIPKYLDSTIKIDRLVYDDTNDTLEVAEVLYEKKLDINEINDFKYALKINLIRSEGIPMYKMTVTRKDDSRSIIVMYNGKDGAQEYEQIDK